MKLEQDIIDYECPADAVTACKGNAGRARHINTWCPDCSVPEKGIYNRVDVFIYPTSEGARVKCVHCLSEWLGRYKSAFKQASK